MNCLQAGDLLFFYGRGFESRAIEWATWGPSHVGMIWIYRDTPLLLESTTLCTLPCAIRGIEVRGVQAHFPQERARVYEGQVYLASIRSGRRFRDDQSLQLTQQIWDEHFSQAVPTPYDLAGALESLTLIPFLRYPDPASQFCSALVSDLLMDFSKINNEPSKGITPAGLLRRVKHQGTHSRPQLVN